MASIEEIGPLILMGLHLHSDATLFLLLFRYAIVSMSDDNLGIVEC